ncbi:MAG: Smr/MutS family protein [Spirochaetes bacterium]|nr:Smr/MutS family protein [Spirochaetota bacterium]
MDFDTIRILEFNKIIEELSLYCKTFDGKENIKNIKFYYDKDSLKIEQDIIEEFYSLKVKGINYNPINLDSFSQIFSKIVAGIVPEIDEFKNIFVLLQESINFRNFFIKNKNNFINFLKKYNIKFYDFSDILDFFNKIFDNEFNIKDSASVRLKEIRVLITSIERKLRNLIDSYFKRSDLQEILASDSFIIKNNKFLIPVKTNFKGKIKGIISEISSSGKTFFIETYEMIELNNKLFSLKSEEIIEIYRILRELSINLRNEIDDIKAFYDQYIIVDIYIAKVSYFFDKKWERAFITENEIVLNDCYHPFLKDPVKNNLKFNKDKPVIIISGPNTGGKTVLLKTIGLIALLFQAGFFIPTGYNSKLPIFNNIFIDCGDEQSIDRSLSTFSSHLLKIDKIIKNSDSNSLVLIDEIGTGTSPEEGEALSIAIVEKLKSKGCFSIISSHFEKVKLLGLKNDKILSCSMRFDSKNLKPLYIFDQNIFGQSFAIEIAESLNFDSEIINTAKNLLKRKFDNFLVLKIEDILNEYNSKIKELDLIKKEYEKKLEEIKKLEEKYSKDSKEIKNELIKNFYNEFLNFKKDIEKEINLIKTKGYDKSISKNITQKFNQFSEMNFIKNKDEEGPFKNQVENLEDYKDNKKFKFNIGDFVKIKDLNTIGKVLGIKGDKIRVNINNIIFETIKENLQIVDHNDKRETYSFNSSSKNIKYEIDLRGFKVYEAEAKLDEFLDKALLSNYEKLYIIHGKGDGILSRFVHEYLKSKKFVKSFSFAPIEEGGNGCTIVFLK